MELGEVMVSCEARLLKQKIISGPFTAKEIAEGALWDHLTQEDYDAPLEVGIVPLWVTCDSPAYHIEIPHSTLTTSDSLVVTTHVFSFPSREEHNWQPRLMPLKHQPGSWFPSSLRRSLRRSKGPERKVTPSFPLFQPSLYLPVNFNPILMVQISLSELMEDIDLDTFLKEDQVTLAKRGRESVAWVVRELWDYLQHECGEGEALPNNVFHDIILQVHTCTYIYFL